MEDSRAAPLKYVAGGMDGSSDGGAREVVLQVCDAVDVACMHKFVRKTDMVSGGRNIGVVSLTVVGTGHSEAAAWKKRRKARGIKKGR